MATTGKTYTKVFEGYGPGWDRCTECGRTLELPVSVLSAMRKAFNNAQEVFPAAKKALKLGMVLTHRNKTAQELHDKVQIARWDLNHPPVRRWDASGRLISHAACCGQ